jgi:hypothetical protein
MESYKYKNKIIEIDFKENGYIDFKVFENEKCINHVLYTVMASTCLENSLKDLGMDKHFINHIFKAI